MVLMGQLEGTGGFTVFIQMKRYYLLERGVHKAKRKHFAPNTEVNHISARTEKHELGISPENPANCPDDLVS